MQKVNSPLTDEFNKVMPLWPKMARPIGCMFRFILYGKHKKNLLVRVRFLGLEP